MTRATLSSIVLALLATLTSATPRARATMSSSAAHGERAGAVTVSTMTYDGTTYTPNQAVPIFRGVKATITVKGINVNYANAVQVVNTSGTPASGVSASLGMIRSGLVEVIVSTSSSAAFGDYTIRLRYPIETNGPDVFSVRLHERGTVTGLSIQGANPAQLIVGTKYTLVATGTELDRATCCGALTNAPPFTLRPITRTSTQATFELVMTEGFGLQIRAEHFYDGNLPKAPPACGAACYGGSGSLTVNGVVSPQITSVSPRVLPAPSTLTLAGSSLNPTGWTPQLVYREKYGASRSSPQTRTGSLNVSGSGFTFYVSDNIDGDSATVLYQSPTSSAEQLLRNIARVPSFFVSAPPVVFGTGGQKLMTNTTNYYKPTPFFVLRPGTATVIGKHLLSPPTVTTTTSLTTTTLTVSRTAPTTTLVPLGSPVAPTVTFNSTPLTVQSAGYVPTLVQPSLADTGGYGADRVVVAVPTPAATQMGRLTVTTTVGSAYVDDVVLPAAPRVTDVVETNNPTASGSATGKLVIGASYTIHGSNLDVRGTTGNLVHLLQKATVKLNGMVIGNAATMASDRVTFTVPSNASSGVLTVEHDGGVASAGSYTVVAPVATPSLSGMVVAPSPVVGGTSTTATITFAGTIPTDGSAGVITVGSADTAAVPPIPAVTITSNPMVVQIPTRTVSASKSVTIVASLGATSTTSSSRSAPLTIVPPKPTALGFAASSITGSKSLSGTVRLDATLPASAGYPVTLSSSDPTTLAVPSTVAVGGNAATFTATTSEVTTPHAVTVTASIAGTSVSATVTVNPPGIASLAVPTTSITSGAHIDATFTFDAPVTSGTLQLTSSDSTAVYVPAPIPVSGTSKSVSLLTRTVKTPKTLTLTGTLNGISKSVTLTVNPLLVQSVVVSPATIAAGTTASVTIRLSAPAPTAESVRLTVSDSTAVQLVNVGASFAVGQDVAVVALQAKSPITTTKSVTITATMTRYELSTYATTSAATGTVTVTP